jgi:hypothetical protein
MLTAWCGLDAQSGELLIGLAPEVIGMQAALAPVFHERHGQPQVSLIR